MEEIKSLMDGAKKAIRIGTVFNKTWDLVKNKMSSLSGTLANNNEENMHSETENDHGGYVKDPEKIVLSDLIVADNISPKVKIEIFFNSFTFPFLFFQEI